MKVYTISLFVKNVIIWVVMFIYLGSTDRELSALDTKEDNKTNGFIGLIKYDVLILYFLTLN